MCIGFNIIVVINHETLVTEFCENASFVTCQLHHTIIYIVYSCIARCSEGWKAYGQFCYQVFGGIGLEYDEKDDDNVDWDDAKDICAVRNSMTQTQH